MEHPCRLDKKSLPGHSSPLIPPGLGTRVLDQLASMTVGPGEQFLAEMTHKPDAWEKEMVRPDTDH